MDTGVAALLDLLGDAAPPTAPEIPSSPVAEPEPAPSTVPPPQMSLAPSQDRAEPSGAHFMAWLRQRSEEHTSELQSLMRISYAVFCLKKKKKTSRQKNSK